MTTMPKSAGASDTRRSGAGLALPEGGGRVLANAAEAWFSATAECQREMIAFVSMRLEKDAEATREMAACKNAADVAAIQSRWLTEALRDYNAEMGKLTAICAKSANGGAMAQ